MEDHQRALGATHRHPSPADRSAKQVMNDGNRKVLPLVAVCIAYDGCEPASGLETRLAPEAAGARAPWEDDMSQPIENYHFYTDEKYGRATVIDIAAEVASRPGEWFNQTLTNVNDAAVRLSVMKGEYHWHKHDTADEFFLVLDGQLYIDFEDRDTVVLGHHGAYAVPVGVTHRTRARERCIALVIDPAAANPAGD